MWRLFIYFFTPIFISMTLKNNQLFPKYLPYSADLYLLHKTNHPKTIMMVFLSTQSDKPENWPCFWWNKTNQQPNCNICKKIIRFFAYSSAKFNTPCIRPKLTNFYHFVTEHSAVKLIQEFIPYQCYKIVKSFPSSQPTQTLHFKFFLENLLALNSFFLVYSDSGL
jgi:hypothetical protein